VFFPIKFIELLSKNNKKNYQLLFVYIIVIRATKKIFVFKETQELWCTGKLKINSANTFRYALRLSTFARKTHNK
jgi:hypothetical protein